MVEKAVAQVHAILFRAGQNKLEPNAEAAGLPKL
jgi:hypothetical protein